jgi:bifunctional DNA-binding transcriptional regulator/antitoxin component of YhaV-PrlF toxin-antitoxin module
MTYVLRQSDDLIFIIESETYTFEARNLTDAKRRAVRKQFHEDSNLRLEDENGKVISIKRCGFKWEDQGNAGKGKRPSS